MIIMWQNEKNRKNRVSRPFDLSKIESQNNFAEGNRALVHIGIRLKPWVVRHQPLLPEAYIRQLIPQVPQDPTRLQVV
jgi:hypothetical protein